ncbi:MAG: hypothetical protein P8L32_01290 [Paracoccaceae bacterium]|nr:hypothetical protein [Paracoccaceae bacterium]
MSDSSRSMFFERASYRRRRARDASRLLPVIGLLVFFIPGLWGSADGGKIVLSQAMIFLFGAWWVAILVAAFLAKYLTEPVVEDTAPDDQSSNG